MPDSILQVNIQPVVYLNDTADVKSISLKIYKPDTNTLICEVNYEISALPVNVNRYTLCARSDNAISFYDPELVRLNLFRYEIITQDSQGNISEPFIDYQ